MRKLILVLALVLPLAFGPRAAAQWYDDFLNQGSGGYTDIPSTPTVAGTAASDLLPGNGSGFGYALRYGGIVPGTETVDVAGKTLHRGQDYQIDYSSGTLTFVRAVRSQESVTVLYRHDPSLVGQNQSSGQPLLAFSFGQGGAIKASFGLMGAERLQDGSILQRMTYGIANNFQLGGGSSLSGIYFMSSQQGVKSFANPNSPDTKQGSTKESVMDRFIYQNLALKEGGFRANVNYSDIGAKFNGFEGLTGQGASQDQVNQWQKEKGINRLGYSLGYGTGSTDFSSLFSRITDGQGSIERRGFDFKAGAASFSWSSRWVDPQFTRFKDLNDADAQQWAKEKGITRDNMGAALALKDGLLKYDDKSIRDAGGEIHQQNLSLDTKVAKLSHYDQTIGTGFTRFGDLAEGERGQWQKETGFHRSGFRLQLLDFMRRKDVWNTFAEDRVETSGGDFVRRNLMFNGLGWGLRWTSTQADAGFSGLGNLRPDEQDAAIHEIHQSYQSDDNAIGPKDKEFLVRQAGLTRDYRGFSLDQKFGKLAFDMYSIDGKNGGIDRKRFGLSTKTISFNYLDQSIDAGFSRIGDLLESERKFYANETGLSRHEWSLGLALGKNGTISVRDLALGGEGGGFTRRTIGFKGGNYELLANFRNVDNGFTRAADLADPETGLLSELRGFKQFDFSGKIKLLKNLSAELFQFGASNPDMAIERGQTKFFINWAPDKNTGFTHLNDRLKADSPIASLSDYQHEKTTLNRDFGKIGKLASFTERESSGGTTATGVDKQTQYWKYEGSPFGGLGLVSEHLVMDDSAGNKEHTDVNGISGNITKRLNLSVTEKTIDRDDKRADEVHRIYGVGYDLGKGTKFQWSYTRMLNSQGLGKATQNWSISQTTFRNLELSGGYVEDRSDATNTKATGQFGLKNTKPFRFGPLKNATFAFGYQSLAEATVWKTENKTGSFSADWGTSKLAWSYGGAMTPSGFRAVDRTFNYTTNPDPKQTFHANVLYKIRTLPGDIQQIIRTYHLDYKMGNFLTLTHDLSANPEKAQQNVPFGTIINPTGTSNWALGMRLDKRNEIVGSYLTNYDDTKGQVARKGGLTLNMKNPKGLDLWSVGYGLESSNIYGNSTIGHTVSLRYSYTVNPQNALSFSIADTQYQHAVPNDRDRNWTVGSVDYTLRF